MIEFLKKIILFFLLSIVFLFPTKAQFQDDFSDGNFTENPAWNGNTALFQINANNQLQLNAPEAGTAFLSTFHQRIRNTEWQFWIRLNFPPSNNNFARVYIASDHENLQEPLNGYFLQFGESSNNDAIELYRQNGTAKTLICRAEDGMIASSFAIRVKITCSESGTWTILADLTGGTSFIEIAFGEDDTVTESSFFGIVCQYTSSNSTKFYFDDFYAGDEIIDNNPPELISLKPLSNNSIELIFNEAITELSAINIHHYHIVSDNILPASAILQNDQKTVLLSFDFEFIGNQSYTLNIQNIEDVSGNVADSLSGEFVWMTTSFSDVIFNEIMADPTPAVDLPEWEFIELYNRTSQPIDLNNWTLTIGTSVKTFIETTIAAHGYLILCHGDAVNEFKIYGETIGIISSKTALTNSGQSLILRNPEGIIISQITYSDNWYGDNNKKEGGWSLERIDTENFCGTNNNWTASDDEKGGTPGDLNSVFLSNPDTEKPTLSHIDYINSTRIMLYFSEQVDTNAVTEITNWHVDGGLNIEQIALVEPDFSAIFIVFSEAVEAEITYSITVATDLITDCYGNFLEQGSSLSFQKQKDATPYDVIFNEIMADPAPAVGLPEFEYIELFNRSEYPINVSGWMLSIGTTTNVFSNTTIAAHGYLILCHGDAVNEFENYGKTIGIISSKTALTNSGQSLILRNPEGIIISQITYSDIWYNDAIKKEGGWSLEQIDPENYCGTIHNWTASIDESGGTPGKVNSVLADNPDEESPLLLRAEFLSENRITLFFNKPMDAQTVSNTANWRVDEGLSVAGIFPVEPDFMKAQVIFSASIIENEIYTISVETDNVTDCSGNILEKGSSVQFAKPEPVEKNDIVINEILHNAQNDGVQYVELYNRSNKIVDVKYLRFIFEKTTNTDSSHCMLPSFLLFPQSFCVLTKSPETVERHYDSPHPETFLTVTNFPTMVISEGIVRIAKIENAAQEVDAVRYSKDMHAALLNTYKGVSLERINPERPSGDQTNWHSAAELVGFGTPGYQNSQFDGGSGDENISIDPDIFTPNNDGSDDYLNIRYQFDEAGYTMNVYIFDARGSRIRHLINNESIGTEGSFSWDGKNESGQLANAGIYIMMIEVFDINGHVKRFKKTSTLGVKF